MDRFDVRGGFEDLVSAHGIDDPDSPARVLARRTAQLLREHRVAKLEELPSGVLEELRSLVGNSAGSNGKPAVVTPPRAARRRLDVRVGRIPLDVPLDVLDKRIEIVPGFAVEVDGDRVTLFHREPVATYTVGQARAIANVMKWLVEQGAN